jgi:hypothetical protein
MKIKGDYPVRPMPKVVTMVRIGPKKSQKKQKFFNFALDL